MPGIGQLIYVFGFKYEDSVSNGKKSDLQSWIESLVCQLESCSFQFVKIKRSSRLQSIHLKQGL